MRKRLNKEQVEKIKFLRSQGHSLPEISLILQIPKTTVYHHIQGVQILPEFVSEWAIKQGGSRRKKLQRETLAFEEGKKQIGRLSSKEKLLFLCALYWAEGSKKDFGLSNTDPELIRTFISGLRELFHLSEDRFRISIRIYEDLDPEKCLDFWSEVVTIPKEKFLKVDVLPGRKKGKLEYGMCRIRVTKGGDLLKKVVGINKAYATSII